MGCSDHASEPLLGHLIMLADNVANEYGLERSGYRVVINQGPDSGQEISHLHLHVLGGRRLESMG
jgi:histidine triad (HIT) family protein